MRAIDTNVLVRLIARDDPRQTERADKFTSEAAWVSSLVLAESVWVLESVYALKKVQVQTAIAMLLEHRHIVLQDAGVVRAALDAFGAHKGVGFTDCLVLAIAKKNGHRPMGTFDRKLARLADVQAL